ncbi:MAG: cell division protein ZapA [Alphaproteobacteria bacterium]|nr:cell division protein ZapA [Alphaproteobacteria bacterium]
MTVRITIRGRQYTLRSDEPEEDLEAVAAYVDRKMAEISNASFDEYTVAMLSALNIASEYHRFRRQVADRLDEYDRELATVGAILDAALPPEPDEDEG